MTQECGGQTDRWTDIITSNDVFHNMQPKTRHRPKLWMLLSFIMIFEVILVLCAFSFAPVLSAFRFINRPADTAKKLFFFAAS